MVLNADTTLANSINADGATITKATAGKGHWALGFDGLIHLPLIVGPATQRNDHDASASDSMFNELRSLTQKYGVRPSENAFITDIKTWLNCMSLTNIRTLDKFGPMATILTGQLAQVEGIPVIVSEQMRLADSDGKVTSGGNTAVTGRLLLVNRNQWRVGFRRELSIETDRDIQKRQNIMVASMRIALAERTGSPSTAKHTALQYNITDAP